MSTINLGPNQLTNGLVFDLDAQVSNGFIKTPKQLSGCIAWFDSSTIENFATSSSNLVSIWNDKSGNNYYFTSSQLSALTANNFSPLYTANAVNGLGSLYFDGVNDYMFVNSSLGLNGASAYTSFAVLSPRFLNSDQIAIGLQGNPSTGTFEMLAYWAGLNDFRAGFDGGAVLVQTTSRNDNRPVINSIVRNGTSANAYLNGYQFATNTTVASTVNGSVTRLGIGANTYNNGIQTYKGYICEIIIYNRALSTTEISQIEKYLSNKWRIPLFQKTLTNRDLFLNKLITCQNNNIPIVDNVYRLNPANATGTPLQSNFYFADSVSWLSSYIVGTITLEAWVKPNSFTFFGNNTDLGTIMIANSNFYLSIDSNGKFNAYLQGSAASTPAHLPSTTSVTRHAWNHVVWTYDGAYVRWYLNGVLDKTSSTTYTLGTLTLSNYIGVGSEGASTFGRFLDGYVSDCKIYNRALNGTEIQKNYNENVTFYENLPNIVTSNLQLYLDADIHSSYSGSNIWKDLSGNANDATLQNSPTFVSTEPKNITLNGSNQYATVTINSGLRVSNITQEVWVFLSNTTDQVFIGCQYGTSSDNSFAIWVQSGAFAFGVNTGGTFYYSTTSTVSSGVWYHLTHTYNGTTQLFYINGVLAATYNSAASGNITYNTNNTLLVLGADWNGPGYNSGATGYVNGKMSIVKIYNTALTAAQVLQNYNATKFRFGT